MKPAKPIQNRYEFVLLFDVADGNPNGDPENGNAPRIDSETQQGLVSDVCLKRKIRNYIQFSRGDAAGSAIFVRELGILEDEIRASADSVGLSIEAAEVPDQKDMDGDPDKPKARPKKPPQKNVIKSGGTEVDAGDARSQIRASVCSRYYDVRAFGAVLTTINTNVRGPVQLTFARSIDKISPKSNQITRMAVASRKEAAEKKGQNQTLGNKYTVRYALYRAHSFVSPALAGRTGFTQSDLDLLWEALQNMFDHDRSAARGQMATRRLVIFEHDSALGSAPAHKLFDLVRVKRATEGPVCSFGDYDVMIDKPPSGVRLIDPMAW